jgi:hypothetical protein
MTDSSDGHWTDHWTLVLPRAGGRNAAVRSKHEGGALCGTVCDPGAARLPRCGFGVRARGCHLCSRLVSGIGDSRLSGSPSGTRNRPIAPGESGPCCRVRTVPWSPSRWRSWDPPGPIASCSRARPRTPEFNSKSERGLARPTPQRASVTTHVPGVQVIAMEVGVTVPVQL